MIGRLILNYPLSPYLLSLVVAGYLFYDFPLWLEGFHNKLALNLPASLFSIMGFVIASAAIVVATQNSGRIKMLTKIPDLWKQLIRVFTTSASTAGVFAIFLLIFDKTTTNALPFMASKLIYTLTIFFSILIVLQVGTAIYGLEQVATLANLDVPEKESKGELRPYKNPDGKQGDADSSV